MGTLKILKFNLLSRRIFQKSGHRFYGLDVRKKNRWKKWANTGIKLTNRKGELDV
jgi:hypothetical protein